MLDNNKQGYKTLSHIWAAYIQHSKSAITSRRFYDMCASGCKYARLAAGGKQHAQTSFYGTSSEMSISQAQFTYSWSSPHKISDGL